MHLAGQVGQKFGSILNEPVKLKVLSRISILSARKNAQLTYLANLSLPAVWLLSFR